MVQIKELEASVRSIGSSESEIAFCVLLEPIEKCTSRCQENRTLRIVEDVFFN
jgi:hypothetical protein